MSRRRSPRPVPPELRSRLAGAVELVAGDVRVRGAGSRIALLFADELQQRLAARASRKANEGAIA